VRIIIEKPFGRDLASAKALNQIVLNVFRRKNRVYRIDHYLGKDTVCRTCWCSALATAFFEPLWNRNYVDSGSNHPPRRRLASSGAGGLFMKRRVALRDMIQSHVLQLTSLVAV